MDDDDETNNNPIHQHLPDSIHHRRFRMGNLQGKNMLSHPSCAFFGSKITPAPPNIPTTFPVWVDPPTGSFPAAPLSMDIYPSIYGPSSFSEYLPQQIYY